MINKYLLRFFRYIFSFKKLTIIKTTELEAISRELITLEKRFLEVNGQLNRTIELLRLILTHDSEFEVIMSEEILSKIEKLQKGILNE